MKKGDFDINRGRSVLLNFDKAIFLIAGGLLIFSLIMMSMTNSTGDIKLLQVISFLSLLFAITSFKNITNYKNKKDALYKYL